MGLPYMALDHSSTEVSPRYSDWQWLSRVSGPGFDITYYLATGDARYYTLGVLHAKQMLYQ